MAQKKYEFENINLQCNDSYKYPNILKIVADHEYGLLKKSSFESRVTKLKVQQLKSSLVEFEIDPDISDCKFLRTGEDGCLIGVWQKNMDPASRHSSVYHLKFEYNKQLYNCDENVSCPIISDLSCGGPFFKRMDVTDSCERNIRGQNVLLYVGNTAVSGGRIVLNISGTENSPVSALSEMIWRSPKCVWSCASNSFLGRYAAGTEKGCFIFDHINFMEVENLQTNVLAVEFSKDGHLLYCGRDKEELLLYDARQDVWGNTGKQFCNPLGLNGIKEIKLLSDEVTMVVCGTDGKLWRADLRMKRAIFQYPGYINKFDRRPFSIDEGLDLLCATGDDNCSRLWSLQSGDLLKIIRPVDQERTRSHACVVANQRRWFLAIVQSNVLTPVLNY